MAATWNTSPITFTSNNWPLTAPCGPKTGYYNRIAADQAMVSHSAKILWQHCAPTKGARMTTSYPDTTKLPIYFDGMPTVTHRATASELSFEVHQLAEVLADQTSEIVRFYICSWETYATAHTN